MADLPDSLVCRFIGRSGKFLLKIYAKNDIWDLAARETFVNEIRTVDKEVTGNPLQVYEASRHMKRSYQQAAVYALVTIVLMLWLDFGSVRYVLLALLPLGLGVLQMFGLMGFLNIPLNSANMIVLPLIIGLGAENGIHIVNDFRRRTGHYHRMSTATTTAVILNSLTTMVGFAALMVASHQGLWSLGRVLDHRHELLPDVRAGAAQRAGALAAGPAGRRRGAGRVGENRPHAGARPSRLPGAGAALHRHRARRAPSGPSASRERDGGPPGWPR